MKYKFALFLGIAGMITFLFALSVFKNSVDGQFPVVVISVIVSSSLILSSGMEIEEQRKRSSGNGQAVKLENLKAGFYEIVSNGFLESLHCAQTGRCTVKFLVLESQEKESLVEVGIAQRLEMEKILGETARGTKLKIIKGGKIEKVT